MDSGRTIFCGSLITMNIKPYCRLFKTRPLHWKEHNCSAEAIRVGERESNCSQNYTKECVEFCNRKGEERLEEPIVPLTTKATQTPI